MVAIFKDTSIINIKITSMKKITSFFLFCITFTLLQSCSIDKESKIINTGILVGEISNGNPVLTFDKKEIKTNWASNLKTATNSELSPNFEIVSIVRDGVSYFLEAKDLNKGITSRVKLTEDGDILRYSDDNQFTVICSGCQSTSRNNTTQCSPKWNNQTSGFYCTSCDNGDCMKTVSTVSPFQN